MGPSDAMRDLAEPLLAAAGLELWDVEVSAHTVRVLVDRPGGVDLEALSAASAVISPLLDEHSHLMPADRYQFEVSSPGIERNLRTVDQYRRYIGQAVSVKTTAPIGGDRRLRGTLVDADAAGITLALDGAPPGSPPVVIAHEQIQRARTVLVWGPTPKPTGAKPARARRSDAAGTPAVGWPASGPSSTGPDPKDAP